MNGPDDPYQRHYNCRLHHYDWKDAVQCVDHLFQKRSNRHRQPVHIAFIGESTIRDQYFSFLRVCDGMITIYFSELLSIISSLLVNA